MIDTRCQQSILGFVVQGAHVLYSTSSSYSDFELFQMPQVITLQTRVWHLSFKQHVAFVGNIKLSSWAIS